MAKVWKPYEVIGEEFHTQHGIVLITVRDRFVTFRFRGKQEPFLIWTMGEDVRLCKLAEEEPATLQWVTLEDGSEPAGDAVNHPKHYNSLPATCDNCGAPVECIQVVRHMGFDLGNVVKYIWRAGEKEHADEVEDLEKALWYLQDEIKRRKQKRR